jgi:hypothetical protein
MLITPQLVVLTTAQLNDNGQEQWKCAKRWLLDGDVQQIFRFYYQPGQENLGDYPSKHHSADIHQHVRPYYVHMNNSPTVLPQAAKPSSWRGCAETLADPYKGKTPLPRVPNYQEPLASRHIIQQKSPNTWSGRANQYLKPSPETHRIHPFPPIATE